MHRTNIYIILSVRYKKEKKRMKNIAILLNLNTLILIITLSKKDLYCKCWIYEFYGTDTIASVNSRIYD